MPWPVTPRTDARLARGGGHTVALLFRTTHITCARLVSYMFHARPSREGLYKPRGNTAPHTVNPNRARSRGRKPAAAHTRSRAGIGARKPAAAHSQPAGRARQATMAGRRWRRRRHRTCAPTRPMARPPLGTQKTHSTPSSVTTVSSTGSFRRVATNAPRAARVGYLSQGHRPSRSSQPPSYMEPSAYTRRPCPSATREAALVHVAAPRRQSAVPAQSVLHPQAR